MAGIDRQLAAIDAQEKRIKAKLQRLQASIDKAEHERNELSNRRERLQLCRLVGKPVKQKEKWGGTRHKIPIGWLQPVDGDWTEHGAILSV